MEKDIKEAPGTVTKIDIVSVPIKGSLPFQSSYKLETPVTTENSTSFILSLFKRIRFPDLDRVSVDADNQVVLSYDGLLEVETGLDTRVDITYSNITNSVVMAVNTDD